VAKAIARFEEATGYKDFKQFHREQAKAFKRRLDSEKSARTGKPLSRATVHSTLSALRAFLSGWRCSRATRRKIAYADADYFNLSEKDVRIAKATREKPCRRWIRCTTCWRPCQPGRTSRCATAR
jgi:hypothetical protein